MRRQTSDHVLKENQTSTAATAAAKSPRKQRSTCRVGGKLGEECLRWIPVRVSGKFSGDGISTPPTTRFKVFHAGDCTPATDPMTTAQNRVSDKCRRCQALRLTNPVSWQI